MKVYAPDFARRIDLSGAGPCPRPVDIDRTTTGFEQLVSLRVYSFAHGVTIDGEAEDDEVFIVLMHGSAEIAVLQGGAEAGQYRLDVDGQTRAVFLPPHAAYRLSAIADCDIAYARSVPVPGRAIAPAEFAAEGDTLRIDGHATGMDLILRTVSAGRALALDAPSGGRPERIVHLRLDGGAGMLAGERLADWASAVLNPGEVGTLTAPDSDIELLAVFATGTPREESIGV